MGDVKNQNWATIAVIVVAIAAIRLVIGSNKAQVPAAIVLVLCTAYLVMVLIRQRRPR
jgi:hypothetical protein